MQSKICGLTSSKQVKTCISYGADFCGFILNYKKSHRYINYNRAKKLTDIDKKQTKYVGVLVNPTEKEFKKFSLLNLDYFQIYGQFTSGQIKKVRKKYKKKIIIAVQVKQKKDVLDYIKFKKTADIILFDSTGLHKSLSWNFKWIKKIPSKITKMLAGKLNIDMLEKLEKITDIVDVSGALETNKVKDINKIRKFLKKIKKINDKD